MTTKTSEKIINYIKTKGQATAKELTDYLVISPRAVFKQIAKLLAQEMIYKIGKPPKVFYLLKEPARKEKQYHVDARTKKIIENRYLIITPGGEKKGGMDGFVYWCHKNNLDIAKTASDYIKTLKKYDAFRKEELINGMEKMKSTFNNVYIDGLYYLDFYSIERFGKTKLGQLLLYAKQSQNKELMKSLIQNIKPAINRIVKKYKVDTIGFIPPTVKREIQFMKELQKNLNLPLPVIKIVKVKTPIVVPQKTLTKLGDRIENAKTSIIVDEHTVYNNILLIDDAVGSGASMNETAAQMKARKICKDKIIGLAITGSFKGFDVISEV